jgi:pimeloyl-ACP methyl ester carboxylesterase
MPTATTNDNTTLAYEVTGDGTPLVFVHEFAGDMASWEEQMRHFGARYRCLAFNARGYPPSSVPQDSSAYSQARAVDDILTVMDHAGIDKAHVVGLSMGGFATLHLGLSHPERALSLCVAGCGYGAELEQRDRFQGESEANARFLLEHGMEAFAEYYAFGTTRLSFKRRNPRGFEEFKKQLAGHSALGSANTQLGVQRNRPSLYTLKEQLMALRVPTLILTGDEDWPCLVPNVMLKQIIPSAALSVIPNCGHTINLEATDEFNSVVGAFLAQVDCGRWPTHDVHKETDPITAKPASRPA